jgi:hypothetical protein
LQIDEDGNKLETVRNKQTNMLLLDTPHFELATVLMDGNVVVCSLVGDSPTIILILECKHLTLFCSA